METPSGTLNQANEGRLTFDPTFTTKSTKPWSSSLDTGVYGRTTRLPLILAVR